MRISQAKCVCVYGWDGQRKELYKGRKSKEWHFGGSKSPSIWLVLCVCVCVRERERERERERKTERDRDRDRTHCPTTKILCWERVTSYFFPRATFYSFPCLRALVGFLAAIFYIFSLPRPFFSLLSFSDICRIKTQHFKRAFNAKAYRERAWGFLPWGSAWKPGRSTQCAAWVNLEIRGSLHPQSNLDQGGQDPMEKYSFPPTR